VKNTVVLPSSNQQLEVQNEQLHKKLV